MGHHSIGNNDGACPVGGGHAPRLVASAYSSHHGKATVALPIVLPPTVLGFYILIALGPYGPLGRFAHLSLAFTLHRPGDRLSVYSMPRS